MANTNWWKPSSFVNSEGTFKTASMPQTISAYFRKPAKITKPSSRNQSPRTTGRRRMTTHLPARTRSVIDAQRPSMNARQQMYRNAGSSRPTSWHPNYVNEFEQYQMPVHQFYPESTNVPMNTTFAHGLVTPSTYPTIEPYLECPDVPLDQLTGQDLNFVQNTYHVPYSYPYTYNGGSPSYTPMLAVPYQATDSDVMNTSWASVPPFMPQYLDTAPTSPDFLPMPDLGQTFKVAQLEEAVDKDELVGMGLYDSPAQVQSASLLFNGPLPVRRKSMKLEESFEPTSQSDEGDEDAESEPTQGDASTSVDQYQHMPAAADLNQDTTYETQYFDGGGSYNYIHQGLAPNAFMPGYTTEQSMVNDGTYNWV